MAKLGLKRWDGVTMELATTALDPIRAAVKSEIPAHLRLELQDAEHGEQHAMEIKNMAAKRFSNAEKVLRKFWASNGPQFSERGWKKYAEMKATLENAQADFESAHGVLSEAICARVTVANRVNDWVRVEMITRRERARIEEAAQAEPAAKQPETLGERLERLRQRIAG